MEDATEAQLLQEAQQSAQNGTLSATSRHTLASAMLATSLKAAAKLSKSKWGSRLLGRRSNSIRGNEHDTQQRRGVHVRETGLQSPDVDSQTPGRQT